MDASRSDERKQSYNSMVEIKTPNEEEMEALHKA
jgi:hypothetical protein